MLERADTTRKQLLDVALELFSEKGFQLTTVQEIVARAGVTKGAFYHHFESKQEVLLLLHNQFIDDELARFEPIIAQNLSAEETLHKIIVELVLSVEKHQSAVSVWLREWRNLDPRQFAIVKPKRDTFEEIFTKVIVDGLASSEFRGVDEPRIAAFGIIGMCSWVHEWYRPNGSVSGIAIGELYAEMILAGLRKG